MVNLHSFTLPLEFCHVLGGKNATFEQFIKKECLTMICSSLLVNFYDLNLKRKLQPSMSLPCFLCCCWISHHNATFFSVVLYRCWMLPLLPSQFAKAYNDLNRNSHSCCYDVKLVFVFYAFIFWLHSSVQKNVMHARLSDASYGKQCFWNGNNFWGHIPKFKVYLDTIFFQ